MKRILITGGSRGLGLALCRRLLADGWKVITTARRCSPEIDELAAAHGEALQFLPLDLGLHGAVADLSTRARLLEGLDAFVANAAVGTEGLLTLTAEADLRSCVETNLVSTMLVTREVVKGMLAAGKGGSLVFVASVAARSGFAGLSVYAATKGGLTAFSRAVAREYGERGIRSNAVLPGFLDTRMSATLDSDRRERLRRRTPLGRLGTPEDVVGTVAFLLSDEARHVTGTEVVVDGGMTA